MLQHLQYRWLKDGITGTDAVGIRHWGPIIHPLLKNPVASHWQGNVKAQKAKTCLRKWTTQALAEQSHHGSFWLHKNRRNESLIPEPILTYHCLILDTDLPICRLLTEGKLSGLLLGFALCPSLKQGTRVVLGSLTCFCHAQHISV